VVIKGKEEWEIKKVINKRKYRERTNIWCNRKDVWQKRTLGRAGRT